MNISRNFKNMEKASGCNYNSKIGILKTQDGRLPPFWKKYKKYAN